MSLALDHLKVVAWVLNASAAAATARTRFIERTPKT
jgi:hypothetical protein